MFVSRNFSCHGIWSRVDACELVSPRVVTSERNGNCGKSVSSRRPLRHAFGGGRLHRIGSDRCRPPSMEAVRTPDAHDSRYVPAHARASDRLLHGKPVLDLRIGFRQAEALGIEVLSPPTRASPRARRRRDRQGRTASVRSRERHRSLPADSFALRRHRAGRLLSSFGGGAQCSKSIRPASARACAGDLLRATG